MNSTFGSIYIYIKKTEIEKNRFSTICIGRAVGSRIGQMLSKVQDWPKFRPGIAFCTNQFHLPKNGRESLKLVSWNEISIWSIPTTFSDFPFGRVKNCFQGKVLSFFFPF